MRELIMNARVLVVSVIATGKRRFTIVILYGAVMSIPRTREVTTTLNWRGYGQT